MGHAPIIMNRVWSMPSRWTFQIPPIKKLLDRYVGDGKGWIDPFAGERSPAEITNDLNPERKTNYHLDAFEFIIGLNGQKYKGILFDPPYSTHQLKESYQNIGREFLYADTLNASFFDLKELIALKIVPGGIAVSCGWNTIGFGKKNGFKIVEILLVCHGGQHNDTIVTVERKVNRSLDAYD